MGASSYTNARYAKVMIAYTLLAQSDENKTEHSETRGRHPEHRRIRMCRSSWRGKYRRSRIGISRRWQPCKTCSPCTYLARAAKELNVPYLTSGRIADARGVAVRLALGAASSGVNIGTRFMYTVEGPIHKNIKRIIVASSEQDTAHIIHTPYNTVRVFKNKASMELVQIERRSGGAKFENVRELVSGQRGKVVYENDDPDYGIWTTWYIAMGLITDIPTCDELLKTLEKGTEDIVTNMSTVVVKSKL
ncbi:2-nitropropane dioxygenase [Mycena sanguinolenta]|uniref:2-nitropropane dioxygenase n=1 Tax=Mycena sanguinolenta TaxID=230812 RepID=A0A8H7CQA9_9AGAR|nr:2-nitropropane dioxygenase [Mycena sanguinolenta]